MYDTEQEQIEAIKNWWSRWGNAVIGGVLIFVVGYFGVFFYNDQQAKKYAAASDLYQQVLRVAADKTTLTTDEQARFDALFAELSDQHAKSTYTTYAAMLQARFQADAENYSTARETLVWALEQNTDDALDRVITLRIARLQVAEGELDAALATLDSMSAGGQQMAFDELRGDIYQAKGDADAARNAYQSAWTIAQQQGLTAPLLQAKAERFGLL